VSVIVGDLAQPRFGLEPEAWNRLASDVGEIWHCGAVVNWSQGYERLAPANVSGTESVLRLAATVRLKHVHHVSSIAVLPFDGGTYSEACDLDHGGELHGGYAQTKWVSEAMVGQAAQQGLPTTVYRLGTVMGRSSDGAGELSSYLDAMIRGCVQVGLVPDVDSEIDMVPVDYVASAMISLSRGPAHGKVFHLTCPEPGTVAALAHALAARGHPLQSLPFDQWREELFASKEFDQNALFPFFLFLTELDESRTRMPRCDSTHTASLLEADAVRCPDWRLLLETYLDHYDATGYLPDRRGSAG